MPNKEKAVLKTVRNYPEFRSEDDRVNDFKEAMERLQRLEMDAMGRDKVVRKVETNDPIQIIVWSDLHLGSIAGDLEEMERIRDYILDNDNVFVIFAGDEIEGLVAKYLSTNAAKTPINVQQQIEFLKIMFFEPLAESGKIIGMVSEYWGHPGWIADATTINPWIAMAGGLDIPIIINGGDFGIKFKSGEEHSIKIWHNPPGASANDELTGQRDVMLKTSKSARGNGSAAAHIHRMAVAQELYAGSDSTVYYISAGTTKGSNPNKPRDLFGVRLGASLAEPSGQGVNIVPTKSRRKAMSIPFASLEEGRVAQDALTLLNKVESQGTKAELMEKILKIAPAPKISYLPSYSRLAPRYKEARPTLNKITVGGETIKNQFTGMEMAVPYDTLAFEIETELPTVLELLANTRIGASSSIEGFKDLSKFVKNLAKNPHHLMIALRNMIDKGAGKLKNRVDVLDKLVDLINSSETTNNQFLAIMMDESLRQGDWKNKVGKGPEHLGMAPASYLAQKADIPLIHHLSLLKLSIGPAKGPKTLYTGVLADKLENHGSKSRPEWGLSRIYDLYLQEKPGFVAGGHMSAGTMTIFDRSNPETNYPKLIAPGWWAGADYTGGKGNVKVGANPGQAIIFMPGKGPKDYKTFATANVEQTEYMQDALMILEGIKLLKLDPKSVLKRKR
jgi:hypothetical protein